MNKFSTEDLEYWKEIMTIFSVIDGEYNLSSGGFDVIKDETIINGWNNTELDDFEVTDGWNLDDKLEAIIYPDGCVAPYNLILMYENHVVIGEVTSSRHRVAKSHIYTRDKEKDEYNLCGTYDLINNKKLKKDTLVDPLMVISKRNSFDVTKDEEEIYLTSKDLSKLSGLTRRHIQRLTRGGVIKGKKHPGHGHRGRVYRYKLDDVKFFINDRIFSHLDDLFESFNNLSENFNIIRDIIDNRSKDNLFFTFLSSYIEGGDFMINEQENIVSFLKWLGNFSKKNSDERINDIITKIRKE